MRSSTLRDFQRPFTLPDGAVELVLVRHGSFGRGRSGPGGDRRRGHDPGLNDCGRRQAEAVAARLGQEEIDALVVTPLRRTAETVAPLAASLGREPVVVDELREIDLGDWGGRLNEVVGDTSDSVLRRVFTEERWDVIPNAERMEDFAARVDVGLGLAAAQAPVGGRVVAIVHGGVIAEACRQATLSRPFAFLHVDNGSLTRLFRLGDGGSVLHGFNDVAHLTGTVVKERSRARR